MKYWNDKRHKFWLKNYGIFFGDEYTFEQAQAWDILYTRVIKAQERKRIKKKHQNT